MNKLTTDPYGCSTNHTISLRIKSLNFSDSLKYQCFYHNSNPEGTRQFQNWFQINVRDNSDKVWIRRMPWLVGTAVVISMLLVAMVTVVMVARCHRRHRKDEVFMNVSLDTNDSGIESDKYQGEITEFCVFIIIFIGCFHDNLSSVSVEGTLLVNEGGCSMYDYGKEYVIGVCDDVTLLSHCRDNDSTR